MPILPEEQADHNQHTTVSTEDDSHAEEHTDEKTPAWTSLLAFTTRDNIPLLVFAAVCSVIASIANPAQAFITGQVFNNFVNFAAGTITADALIDQQRPWILGLVCIGCGSWLFHFLEFAAWMTFGELQAKNARVKLFQGLSSMEIAWYDLCEDGIQASLVRTQTQIKELQLATSQPLGGVISLICTSLIALGQAFYNSWDLTLVTLAGAPLIAAVMGYFGVAMQVAIDKQHSAREVAQKCVLDTLSNIETVQCFNAEEMELRKYWSAMSDAAYWYSRIVKNQAAQMALLAFLIQSMFVQAFYYGGVLIRNGKKQAAQIVTTFFSAITAFQAIQGVIPQTVVLERGRFAGANLRDAMPTQTASSIPSERPQYKPFECTGNIQLEAVTFSYPSRPEHNALDGVNFVIAGRKLTFLIGKSGSGKSTIGQLLTRLYDIQYGTILLDGESLLDLDVHWLRSHVTLVEQTSTLFAGSIAENIALGHAALSEVSKKDISSAAEFALLQSMSFDLPKGLDTELGLQSDSLSGGQRQRIALARARLRDTPILILDESTSALDQITRELMMEAIRQWRKDKTTIIITHDISQVRPDDYAIVLESGKVVQQGSRQHMEAVAGSPFSRFVAGDATVSRPTSHTRIRPQASPTEKSTKRPTSFLTAASTYLNSFPFYGLTLAPMHQLPAVKSSISSGTSSRETAHEEYDVRARFADNRTTSKKLLDFIQEAGQRAVDVRNPAGTRRQLSRERAWRDDKKPTDQAVEPEDQARLSLLQMFRRMWHDLTPSTRIILVLGYIGGTGHAVSSPVFAYVLSKLLGLYAEPQDTSRESLAYSLAILGLAALDGIHTFIYRVLLEKSSQTWVDGLRKRASKRLTDQWLDFFENETATGLSETLDSHAEEMRNLFGRFVVMLYVAAVILVVALIWALTAEWKMTLMAVSAGPYIFVVANMYTRVTEKWERLSNDASQAVNAVFAEAFGKVKTVRSLGLESHFHQKFVDAQSHSLKTGLYRAIWSGFLYGMSTSAGTLATALVFYVGSELVHNGASVTAVLEVFAILILTISNISAILDYVPQIGSAKEMAERVLRLADLSECADEQAGDTRIMSAGRIDLRELSFAYPSRPDVMALERITVGIKPGITTAIVGGSGSGKSTIAKLLLKLYSHSTQQGRLSISGRDVRYINTRSLRQLTAVVAQSNPLFGASIKENITFGLPDGSPYQHSDHIVRAATQAGIYDFVSSLPDSFETSVGVGGMGLSGGQVQRIAIARALVRLPLILILDEATSALDPESSALVRETIHDLIRQQYRKMTIIMITHNREMMAIADHVVVLDHGRVVETGGFEDLLSRPGPLTTLLRGGTID